MIISALNRDRLLDAVRAWTRRHGTPQSPVAVTEFLLSQKRRRKAERNGRAQVRRDRAQKRSGRSGNVHSILW
jgi:hypothetical protein